MTTKLTLSIDDKAISRAKNIAERRGKSLSKLVEEYFNSISERKVNKNSAVERIEKRIDPYLKKLKLSESVDYRSKIREWKYEDYLKEKE